MKSIKSTTFTAQNFKTRSGFKLHVERRGGISKAMHDHLRSFRSTVVPSKSHVPAGDDEIAEGLAEWQEKRQ